MTQLMGVRTVRNFRAQRHALNKELWYERHPEVKRNRGYIGRSYVDDWEDDWWAAIDFFDIPNMH